MVTALGSVVSHLGCILVSRHGSDGIKECQTGSWPAGDGPCTRLRPAHLCRTSGRGGGLTVPRRTKNPGGLS